MKSFKSQKGFTAIELLLYMLLVAAVIGAGWYVYRMQQNARMSEEESEQTVSPLELKGKEEILYGGKVTIFVPEGWKLASGGYYNVEKKACGQSVNSSEECVDHIMLIPSDETFSNPDQFHLDIGVYKRKSASSVIDWFTNELEAGSERGSKISKISIHGRDAIYYKAQYDDTETRVRYAVSSDSIGVLAGANAFNGDYYSFKNTNHIDYKLLLPQVDQIAKSVRIRE